MNIFCKIFGHKYVQWNWWDKETEQYTYKKFDYCLKCGRYKLQREKFNSVNLNDTKSNTTTIL